MILMHVMQNRISLSNQTRLAISFFPVEESNKRELSKAIQIYQRIFQKAFLCHLRNEKWKSLHTKFIKRNIHDYKFSGCFSIGAVHKRHHIIFTFFTLQSYFEVFAYTTPSLSHGAPYLRPFELLCISEKEYYVRLGYETVGGLCLQFLYF